MSEISRLKDTEISNGNLINADDLDSEFNQLVDESNAQNTRLNTIESGDLTLTGVKTFSNPLKTDSILENAIGAGVTIENIKLQQGSLSLNSRINIATVDTTSNQLKESLNRRDQVFLVKLIIGFSSVFFLSGSFS